MSVSIYVAASSSEIARAKKAMDALRAAGLHVTSTWIEVIQNEGGGNGNPRDATLEQRRKWSLDDVRLACKSRLLWMLMPIGPHSFGATFEYAFFIALANDRQTTFVSGDYMRSIFTSFSECYDTDEQGLAAIIEFAKTIEPDCSCDAKPEPVEGSDGNILATEHTAECALARWRNARSEALANPENDNAAEPEG